eukprot:m.375216 g.375216  ORF g.375216 m.375216 type:complete len:1354 (-) comp28181_c0_seq1:2618-6679(-)
MAAPAETTKRAPTRRARVQDSMKRDAPPQSKGLMAFGLSTFSSTKSFFMQNSLLELAKKTGDKATSSAIALKDLFGAPKRAVLVVHEDEVQSGSVFTVREDDLDALFRDTGQLPPVNRDPAGLRKYLCALVLSDLPGETAKQSKEEMREYVQWLLQMKRTEWDQVVADVMPILQASSDRMQLEIDLIRGVRLTAKDTDGKSDPYCALWLERTDQVPVRDIPTEAPKAGVHVSSVSENTLDPHWNEEFTFELPKGVKDWNGLRLHVVVWDSDANDRRGLFNPLYVGRVLKDAARKVRGKGADDFLGHSVLELRRIPHGGLFLHQLQMEKRSKRSNVTGHIEVTAKFTMPTDLADAAQPNLFQDNTRFRELVYRVVLCEATRYKSADAVWDCGISAWAHSLINHGTFTSGISLCQSLSCELEVLTFCTKNPDLPEVTPTAMTSLLTQLLFIAARKALTVTDVEWLTSAVTNVMAERAEDLKSFLDERRFKRNDCGEDKLRTALTQYSLCFTTLKMFQRSVAAVVAAPPAAARAGADVATEKFRVDVETLTGTVRIMVEATDSTLALKGKLHRKLEKRCVPPSEQQLSYFPDESKLSVVLEDGKALGSYGIQAGSTLHLMDVALQDAVKSEMCKAFRPRFYYLVESADEKALDGNAEKYAGHEMVASIQLVQAVLADLMVLEDPSAFRGVLERFGGKDGDTWAYIHAVTSWNEQLSKIIVARLPKHVIDLTVLSADERDTAMSLTQFSFKLYFEMKAFCQALRTHNVQHVAMDSLTIFRFPAWFMSQIESYFVAAEEQGKAKMLNVVQHDSLEKFSGAKYSTSVRDMLKIAYEVLDTWESLGPDQWTQMDLEDRLLEDAIAWNIHLSSVITDLIESWTVAYKERQSKMVHDRDQVMATDEGGHAVVTEAGCVALNNVCQVITSIPHLKKKIEGILVSLHQSQVAAIQRILASDPARAAAIVKEKQQLATHKLDVLDYEFSDIIEHCTNLQNGIIDSVTGQVSQTLSALLLDACVSSTTELIIDPEKIAEDLNPPLDYLYNNLMTVVKKHSFDEIFASVVSTFWRATLQALIESALCTHSLNDRLQLGQKFVFIKDEFRNYGLPVALLDEATLSQKVNKIIELKMSNTGDIFVEYLKVLGDIRPIAPTKLGSLTISAMLESEPGGEGTIRTHTLRVRVMHGDNLIPLDKNGLSDPVIVATLHGGEHGGEAEGHRQKTSTQRKTLNPKWGETLEWKFSASRLCQRAIHFQMYDVDDSWGDKMKMRGAADPMGECSIVLFDLIGKDTDDITMNLTGSMPPDPVDEGRLSCREVFRIIKDRGQKNAASPKEQEAKKLVSDLTSYYHKLKGQDEDTKWITA